MPELNLAPIIEAAELAVNAEYHRHQCMCDLWPENCRTYPGGVKAVLFTTNAYDAITAAAPLLERAVREQVAAERTWYERRVKALEGLLDCYRVYRRPSEKLYKEWHFTATALAEEIPGLLAEIRRLRVNVTSGRLTHDISAAVHRLANGRPEIAPLLTEAAGQLDELITLLAKAETVRDEAVAERDHALAQIKKPDYGRLVGAYLSGAVPVAEQRNCLQGQIVTLMGIVRDMERMEGYDPATASVTVHAIKEIFEPEAEGGGERLSRRSPDAASNNIDDAVDVWHEGDGADSLAEHLGLSWEQYARWAEKGVLPDDSRFTCGVLAPIGTARCLFAAGHGLVLGQDKSWDHGNPDRDAWWTGNGPRAGVTDQVRLSDADYDAAVTAGEITEGSGR